MWTLISQSISLLLVIFLSASVLTDGDGTTNNENGGTSGRIIDGEEATPHEFPFQVAVVGHFKESHRQVTFCGGIIIHEQYILTAAHCTNKQLLKLEGIDASQLYFKVYAGYHDLPANLHGQRASTAPAMGQDRKVKAILEHRGFQPLRGSLENDINVLEVEPLQLSASGHVEKIDLPDANYTAKGVFTAMGWGRTDNDPNPKEMGISRRLRKANLPFVSDDVCSKIYKKKTHVVAGKRYPYPPVTPPMICAGGTGKDICQGDSGGSLIKDENGKRLIVGIVSWGNGQLECGKVGVPSVFTEVSQYRQWIQDRLDGKPLSKSDRVGVGSVLKLSLSIFYLLLLTS